MKKERFDKAIAFDEIFSAPDWIEEPRSYSEFVQSENVKIMPSEPSDTTHPLVIEMILEEEWFDKLKNGTKTVEVRLCDEKRQKLMPGDITISQKGSCGRSYKSGSRFGLQIPVFSRFIFFRVVPKNRF